ncbi:MAG: ATP-binding protein [Nitrososphaerota archaeon]
MSKISKGGNRFKYFCSLADCGMLRCSKCKAEAEPLYRLDIIKKSLCHSCFIEYYEKKVKKTVLKYRMLSGVKNLGVAVSGGKDSMALLKSLLNIFPSINFVVIHLNLGIPGYSDTCQTLVQRFCQKNSIECIVYDLRNAEGYSLKDFVTSKLGRRICGICGVVKRYLLNKIALENDLDAIATGHNLDDTVELLFNHYINGALDDLVRNKPVLPSTHPKIVKKIKPLIEMTEQENLYYVLSTHTEYVDNKCPLVKGSRMMKRKKLLMKVEEEIPNFKHLLFKTHLKRFLPILEKHFEVPALRECERCGMPSKNSICSYCKLISKLRIPSSATFPSNRCHE